MRLYRRHFWRPLRRRLTASLALLAYATATFGFPLPAPAVKDHSQPYPCENRPCGCLTAEQCWQGDCCCFTLEEKLAWAEANGIEPPKHVRPLVESRKARRATPMKKSCCSESNSGSVKSILSSSSCCGHSQSTGSPCCSQKSHEVEPNPKCPHCNPKPGSKGCEKKSPATGSGVRWIVGIFAQKCRGEGPAGMFQLDPAIVSDLTPTLLAGPGPVDWVAPRSVRLTPSSHCPPPPPPRCS
jgi:hypothetical protein